MKKTIDKLTDIIKKVSIENKIPNESPKLVKIDEYENKNKLIEICKSFENQYISLNATFMGIEIPVYNCNAVGDILEDIFYPIFKKVLDDFEEGPKQAPPDYYAMNKKYAFEQKVFMCNPGFDIGNFTSYVNQLCENDGVYNKLFNTKYLIFEYMIDNKKIKIITFHFLNVYNLVSYTGKYPISMQVKKKIWYNIRPCSPNDWYSNKKTPNLFIENIIKSINQCPHIEDKVNKINSISKQFNELKSKYTF